MPPIDEKTFRAAGSCPAETDGIVPATAAPVGTEQPTALTAPAVRAVPVTGQTSHTLPRRLDEKGLSRPMDRDELHDWLYARFGHPRTDEIMEQVDAYAAHLAEEPPEGWTANQVAEFLGLNTAAAARSVMSRWGIKSFAFVDHPITGRHMALYPAEKVRADCAERDEAELSRIKERMQMIEDRMQKIEKEDPCEEPTSS